ncbi:unnamed protein product [Thlaspi arvense]|uniref:Histidine-containing phosphotransfer protein n=1 Tax=Thlaspi arvense TaxID=13288 RepID=A0AAU9S125_THLAR|nr:unnamed protein product [Thlaspi arvense]
MPLLQHAPDRAGIPWRIREKSKISDFVSQVVSLFFQDSDRILNDLSLSLHQQVVDFKKVDPHVHQLKGSSSSIGAQRVKNACVVFRSFCEQQNVEACHRCLQQVKQEYYLVKNRLETLFKVRTTNTKVIYQLCCEVCCRNVCQLDHVFVESHKHSLRSSVVDNPCG